LKKIVTLIIVLALIQVVDSGRLNDWLGSASQIVGQSLDTSASSPTVAGSSPTVDDSSSSATSVSSGDRTIVQAFEQQRSSVQVQGRGRVARILADDNDGSAHQRFIVDLDSGHTLLIAHNIDLAPRVAGLKEGDVIEFFGEYEWNSQGGVMHWTHRDPQGRHVAGWLRHAGKTYQ
jgi:hypothetical protein